MKLQFPEYNMIERSKSETVLRDYPQESTKLKFPRISQRKKTEETKVAYDFDPYSLISQPKKSNNSLEIKRSTGSVSPMAKKLIKISHISIAISRMQRESVSKLENSTDIRKELDAIVPRYSSGSITSSNTPKERIPRREAFQQHLGEHRKVFLFCFCAERGSKSDIEFMKELIESDPKKFILCHSDPRNLVNHKNSHGMTPLYLAAKNGNLEVVKFLTSIGVEYSISHVKVSKFKTETPLEAAIRWNHVDVVDYLLENFRFASKELRVCLIMARNIEIRNMLLQKGAKLKTSIFTKLLC